MRRRCGAVAVVRRRRGKRRGRGRREAFVSPDTRESARLEENTRLSRKLRPDNEKAPFPFSALFISTVQLIEMKQQTPF